jgi:hypothetical protein
MCPDLGREEDPDWGGIPGQCFYTEVNAVALGRGRNEKEAGPVSWAVPFKDGGKQLFLI